MRRGRSRSMLGSLPHLLGSDLISIKFDFRTGAVTVTCAFRSGAFLPAFVNFAHALPRGFTTLAYKATLTLF